MMWHRHNTLLLSMTSEIEKTAARMFDEEMVGKPKT
jgi:hypothetical protein